MDIHWPSGVITVYKTDPFMTWTGGSIYNMDTEGFRRALKAQEDTPIGIAFPKTHNHNTTVLLGGIEYARIIDILPPYTITFDDTGGGWVCNLIGSNNNILDRTNLTSVQVRSNNSAGLVQTQEIQHGIFNGGVTIDQENGVAGTIYPAGTPIRPVNNIADARIIAELRGFSTFFIKGNLVLGLGDDVSGKRLVGDNAARTFILVGDAALTQGTEIVEAAVTGILDGNSIIRTCYVFDLSYVSGFLFQCELAGTVTLGGGTTAHIMSCYAEVNHVDVDMDGASNALNMQAFSGHVCIVNKTGADACGIHMLAGAVTIDASVTNTTGIHISGVAAVENNSGLPIAKDETVSIKSIWGANPTTMPAGGIGEWLYKKVLTIPKYLGLK
jgi:hypothetical protein